MKKLDKLFPAFSARPLMLLSLFALLPTLANAQSENINFADPAVKNICVANWDSNEDKEISYDEAAAVTDIGKVFYDSDITSFDELQYFTGLTSIADDAFCYCHRLSSVIIPNSVNTIGISSFFRCQFNVVIPNSVKRIKSNAFGQNHNITSVTIPSSVTIIDNNPFMECDNLTSINVESDSKYFSSDGGVLYNKDKTKIVSYPYGKIVDSFDIPNTVNTIGGGAFQWCKYLAYITIPNSVTSIGNNAFCGCEGLLSVLLSNSLTNIGEAAFNLCTSLSEITIPKSVKKIGNAFQSCKNLRSIYCEITEPFDISEYTFKSFEGEEVSDYPIYTDATLYVPEGCKEKYQEKAGWKKFKNIVEMAPTGIAIDETNFPDENFRNWVLDQDYGHDGVLTEDEIAGVTYIDVSEKNIASLKGVEYFTALKQLYCFRNQLTSLDVSKNTALEALYCDDNQLTSLDVSKNTALRTLWCQLSLLTSLDVSKNTPLTELYCGGNQLTSLDVSKNTALTELYCGGNQLTALDVSKNTALTELHCISNQLTALDVSKNTALTYLSCSYNQLTSLDVSHNTALEALYCDDIQLTSLDVSQNTALRTLWCQLSQLTSLDVSKNTALTELVCGNNQLTSLDVSKNTALTELACNNNQLTSLDVSKNTALTELYCGGNQLTSLDVSKNTALTELSCWRNQLTSLDVSKNTALTELHCYSNQILETEMGNLVESLPANNGELYVKDLSNANEQNVITTTQVAVAKAKGWKVYAWDENWNRVEYDGEEPQDMSPVEQGETIDIGNEIDENTNLDGNVVGDVYYCISSGDGNYDPEEGCIVVTKPTDDSAIDGKDIFGEDFKDGYTGFVFMVAPGKGTIKVEAQTIGNMVLKVRVGDNAPTQMEVNGKTKVSFSYDVSEPTMVFIYGSIGAAGAKGMRKASGTDALKIYGIEVSSETDGIKTIDNERLKMKDSPVYNLSGQRIISSPSGRPGGVPKKGIYIINDKKMIVR